jgi:hypothetical protein
MRAIIFYATGQTFLANTMSRCFKEFGDLVELSALQINNTESKLSKDEIETIKEYVCLLNAARRKPNETFIMPCINREYGFIRYIWIKYLNYSPVTLDLCLTDGILPAIAIDNRMVIMPNGTSNIFKLENNSKTETILKPIEEDQLYGISEVDFLNVNKLREIIHSKILMAIESIKLSVSNYVNFHSNQRDVLKISKDMGITIQCTQVVLNLIATNQTNQELQISFPKTNLKFQYWEDIELCITNLTKNEITIIEIRIDGPFKTEKVDTDFQILPGKFKIVPISILALEVGLFPADIKIRWWVETIESEQLKSIGYEWFSVS